MQLVMKYSRIREKLQYLYRERNGSKIAWANKKEGDSSEYRNRHWRVEGYKAHFISLTHPQPVSVLWTAPTCHTPSY